MWPSDHQHLLETNMAELSELKQTNKHTTNKKLVSDFKNKEKLNVYAPYNEACILISLTDSMSIWDYSRHDDFTDVNNALLN